MVSSGDSLGTSVPEGPEQLLIIFGATVLCVQSTERILHFCLVYVLQVEGGVDIETLRKYETSKKTLGQLLTSLRKHVGLQERFDDYLGEYLSKRNALVHDVTRIDGGWNIYTKIGRDNAKLFLNRILMLDAVIRKVLVTLIRSWAATNPLPQMPSFPDLPSTHFVDEQLLNEIFFVKS